MRIVATIIQNCTFEKCHNVSIDDYYGDKGHIYVVDCIFENIVSFDFESVKVSKSHFKNIESNFDGLDEVFVLENVTIEDSIFENISLKNEAFLFNAFGCCEIVNSTFINIFTDRVDMMLSNYEKEDGWGFLKTSYQSEIIDKNTCTGLDMINVIKGKI
ncbi:MAG: hypothetical protein IJ946_04330 [Clostridia bacterium]|nr:hypothetical protein [Clostridia bacterium]